jgi:hypothetical protein
MHDAIIAAVARVRMKCLQLLVPAALAASASACGTPSAPSTTAPGSLHLSAAITPTTIDPDGDATITFTLENRGSGDLNLTFPGGCKILPYIRAGNVVVYPTGGGWVCPAIIAMATLHAGESIKSEVHVRAAARAEAPVVPLAHGDYTAFATVDTTEQHLTSDSVAFSVRDR